MYKVIERGYRTVEIESISEEPTVYSFGKRYRTAAVNLIDNGIRYNNLCLNVYTDEHGDYLDFTKTRYEQFGKVTIK